MHLVRCFCVNVYYLCLGSIRIHCLSVDKLRLHLGPLLDPLLLGHRAVADNVVTDGLLEVLYVPPSDRGVCS